ncbi:MAG: RNA polymerase factor sigma-54 [Sulfurospirillum sp.]|nr:MAG: RNA polymerase factor sigma-54 [Sulfurospirillum sp.]
MSLGIKLNAKVTQKGKLSQTMRNWLPILQADIESLKEELDKFAKTNPFVEIKAGQEISSHSKKYKNDFKSSQKNAISNEIEAMSMSEQSLYDKLYEQIVAPLFPTQKSKDIAYRIIEHINDDGYFDADPAEISKEIGVDVATFERVRARFAYLEPSGVGATDLLESFLFQLNDFDLSDDVYKTCVMMIEDFENLERYQKEPLFNDALRIIKKFKNPPALNYKNEQYQIIPDIIIDDNLGEIKVRLNEAYYPQIVIDRGGLDDKFDFIKKKIKEAKSLVDALELRKATLTKIALMIIEYQYEFFQGGAIKPMKLDDLANDLERHHSTISRAISNKYLSCSRGVFPIKSFFALAVNEDNDTSNAQIKEFIANVIKNEDRKKPLSDNKILQIVEKEFGVKLGRRTITKYRISLGLLSSSDRKKHYALALM